MLWPTALKVAPPPGKGTLADGTLWFYTITKKPFLENTASGQHLGKPFCEGLAHTQNCLQT